jgi:hypothetical protein
VDDIVPALLARMGVMVDDSDGEEEEEEEEEEIGTYISKLACHDQA